MVVVGYGQDIQVALVWQTSNPPPGATSSYTSSVPAGGGVWYTGSQYTSSVTFSYRTNKDINLDVTNTVKAWTTSSGTIPTTIITIIMDLF
jgi:hypothetical protein